MGMYSQYETGEPKPSAVYLGLVFGGLGVLGLLFFFWVVSRRYYSHSLSSRSQKCLHATWQAIPPTLVLIGFIAAIIWLSDLVHKQAFDVLVILLLLFTLTIMFFATKFDAKTTFRYLPLVASMVFILASSIVAIKMGLSSQQRSQMMVMDASILNWKDVNPKDVPFWKDLSFHSGSDTRVIFTLQYTDDSGATCRSNLEMNCKDYYGEIDDEDMPEKVSPNAILTMIDAEFTCNAGYYFSDDNNNDDGNDNGDDDANANGDDGYNDDAANGDDGANDDGNRRLESSKAYNLLVHPSQCYMAWYTTQNAGLNWDLETDAIMFFGISAAVTAVLFIISYAVLKRMGYTKDDKLSQIAADASRPGCADDDAWTYYSTDSVGNSTLPTNYSGAAGTRDGTRASTGKSTTRSVNQTSQHLDPILAIRDEQEQESVATPPMIVQVDAKDPSKRNTYDPPEGRRMT